MPACTFFGHHDCPDSVKPLIRSALTDLIEQHAVDVFYVGRQGAFDRMVHAVLKELQSLYPHICYAVVLERLPAKADAYPAFSPVETLFPEGLESVPPRFAISQRNRWMLQQSDYVMTYITHPWGGAAQYAALAAKQKKQIISLAPNARPQN